MKTRLAVFLSVAVVSQATASREPRFLNFAAQDEHGIWVRDLNPEEVVLKLDGEPVDIRYFGHRNVDTAFAVVLENSPRTAEYTVSQPQLGRINTIDLIRYEMLDDFFEPMTRIGSCQLSQFDRELETLQAFTQEHDLLVGALNHLQPQPTGLTIDHIQVGRVIARMVDVLAGRIEKRKVLILFTSIVDRDSYQNLEEYRDLLRLYDVELYVVSVAPRFASGFGTTFEEKNNALFFRRLAGETAGRAFMTGEYSRLERLFTDLKGRIQNLYTVGFYVDAGGEVREREVSLELTRHKSRVTYRRILVF